MVQSGVEVVGVAVRTPRRENFPCATKTFSAPAACRSSRILREENSASALRSLYGSKQPSSGKTVPMICRMICFLGVACLVTMGSTAQIAVAGSIVAWGSDGDGQVSSTPTGTGFTAIAGGGSFGYALRADGSIAAWGSDFFGEVSNTPTGTGFTAIAGGAFHGYALRADGSIAAWGSDELGQVSNTPTGTGFTAIASGFNHGYALRAEQTPAVPEPSTVVLTGLGAIAVIWRQSRRRTA